MPLLILSVICQAAFVIHVVKTGRDNKWIWIIMMLPMAGIIAYLFLEVLPDLSRSRTGRKAVKKVNSVLNPDREINHALQEYTTADTVDNSLTLAQACFEKQMFAQSKALYTKCLTGHFAQDPAILLGLANTEFALKNYPEAKDALETLIKENPDYKNQDAHLLYARALEGLGDYTSAEHEYQTLYSYYSGPQASFYYAHFLIAAGKPAAGHRLFKEIVSTSQKFGKHYRERHKSFISQSKAHLHQSTCHIE